MDETHPVIQPLQQCGPRLWKGLFSLKRMKQLLFVYLLDQCCFVVVCSIMFMFPCARSFFLWPRYGTYIHSINKTITFRAPDVWFIHILEVTTGSKAELGEKDEWERSEKTENVRDAYHYEASSERFAALPRPSSFSLGRPCSPLSALGERKRTKDLLLGPDMYTFLVLFFSPRPLGHTKGL